MRFRTKEFDWGIRRGNFLANPSLKFFSCPSSFSSFPQFSVIWKGGIPTKIKMFAWLASLEKVSTCDMVQVRRPFMSLSPWWCALCRRENENVDHILLHCEFVKYIWSKALELFGLMGVFPKKWRDFLIIKLYFKQNSKKIT
ncbi:hypothetical protein LguiA_004748 [Lonicera macranthoides]